MTTKEKARNGGDRASQQGRTSNRDSIPFEPQQGWFNLAKPSRDRQQKRGWKRNNRGRIDPALAAQLALLAVIFLLFVGGVAA